jgi:hypothetical protein
METRLCPECGEPIKGRIDKKFCSDLCRNSFNNKVNSDSNNFVRNVNNALRKNRRLLEEHLSGDTTVVTKQKLSNKGFNFGYYTSHLLTSNHHQYYWCYEYGYRYLENDQIMIVKKKFEN